MKSDNKAPQVKVRVIKADNTYASYKDIKKSNVSEQLSDNKGAGEWIPHPISLMGLREIVNNSTMLPQCIGAYKKNIAGFGISIEYSEDYKEETDEMKAEWNYAKSIVDLLSIDIMAKEVFESIIESREMYGIAYCEVIRDIAGNVAQLEFIVDTPSVDMTYPLEPYVDTTFIYKDKVIPRKKKFRKFRQRIGARTVYFKEFGDPRIMDKRNGKYIEDMDELQDMPSIDDYANEIIEFRLGSEPYGTVRWIGQVLTVDGSRRAEELNNAYFREGRHTPLMIVVKGGTLTDASFDKLQSYINGVKGAEGQHAFLLLETDTLEATTDMNVDKQPEVEIKDLASILQKDELFQNYQENSRRKIQSAFLLPDLYVGYTADFNRATAQSAIEITEKQVFQPERLSLAWIVNNKIFNDYHFKYVQVSFDAPSITNPDDIFKILSVAERAGGLTPNLAKEITYAAIAKDGCEDYPEDWGDVPLAYTQKQSQPSLDSNVQQNVSTGQNMSRDGGAYDPLGKTIEKAINAGEDEELVGMLCKINKALELYKAGK